MESWKGSERVSATRDRRKKGKTAVAHEGLSSNYGSGLLSAGLWTQHQGTDVQPGDQEAITFPVFMPVR